MRVNGKMFPRAAALLAVMPLVSCATTAQKRALTGAGMAVAAAASWALSGVMTDAMFPDRRYDKSQQDANNLYIVFYSYAMGTTLGAGLMLAISDGKEAIQQWSEANKARKIAKQKRKEEEEAEQRRLAAAEEERLAEQKRREEEETEKQRREEEEAEQQRLAAAEQESLAAAEQQAKARKFVVRRPVRAAPSLLGDVTYLFWTGKGWNAFIENARLFESKEKALASVTPLEQMGDDMEAVRFGTAAEQ